MGSREEKLASETAAAGRAASGAGGYSLLASCPVRNPAAPRRIPIRSPGSTCAMWTGRCCAKTSAGPLPSAFRTSHGAPGPLRGGAARGPRLAARRRPHRNGAPRTPDRIEFVKGAESRRSRRRFLKTSGAVVAAVAAPAGAAAESGQEPRPLSLSLDLPLLHAFAEAVLPEEIGREGVEDALRDFVTWMNGFEPVAELPHPYLSSVEVRYGPPHPAPRWASQLQALDLLATKQHGSGLAELPLDERRDLIAADLERHDAGEDLPRPAYAGHVAVGLLARFYSRPQAADLAYGARINARACRDLASGAVLPAPLAATEAQH